MQLYFFSFTFTQTQTDAVLGWVDKNSGRAFVMDTWMSGYNSPLLDPSQDVYNVSGRIENGATTLRFTRKRATNDKWDFSFTDEHCLYMMFPVKGGDFNAVNKKTRKHGIVPTVSSERICIRSCGEECEWKIVILSKEQKKNVYANTKFLHFDLIRSRRRGRYDYPCAAQALLRR